MRNLQSFNDIPLLLSGLFSYYAHSWEISYISAYGAERDGDAVTDGDF